MKFLTCTAIAAALVFSTAACQQQESPTANEPAATEAAAGDLTALNGTWKTDKASVKFEQKPDDILLQGGTYKCSTCIPPLSVAADGQFHDVAGRAYSDSMSVKVVDDKTVEMKSRKGGRDTFAATLTVSADGNTLTRKFKDSSTPNAPAVEGASSSSRAGPAPAGAHAVGGGGRRSPGADPRQAREEAGAGRAPCRRFRRRRRQRMLSAQQARLFLSLTPEEQRARIAKLSPEELLSFDGWFEFWAQRGQLPPLGEGWRVWLMMAGRGFGKTRAGAEWIHRLALSRPVRIALVGATIEEARSVMSARYSKTTSRRTPRQARSSSIARPSTCKVRVTSAKR